jgi:hypothetical protein
LGNYSRSEFEDLVGLCSPRERHLLRYLLAKILGSKVAATRFGMTEAALEGDIAAIDLAINAATYCDDGDAETGETPSKYMRSQAFHAALARKQNGGRTAWEEDGTLHDLTMSLIMKAV